MSEILALLLKAGYWFTISTKAGLTYVHIYHHTGWEHGTAFGIVHDPEQLVDLVRTAAASAIGVREAKRCTNVLFQPRENIE